MKNLDKLKYRIWNIDKKVMEFYTLWDFIKQSKNTKDILEVANQGSTEFEQQYQVMPYTGFIDIDKKPIYENDIVETCLPWCHDNDAVYYYGVMHGHGSFVSHIRLVTLYSGDWSLCYKLPHLDWICCDRRISESPGCLSSYVRVIGNIYEDTELSYGEPDYDTARKVIIPSRTHDGDEKGVILDDV